MARGLNTSIAQDYISTKQVTSGAGSASLVFTPADGPQTGINSKPTAIIAEEITLQNPDATNGIWVRLQCPINEIVSQGINTAAAGVAGGGQVAPTAPIAGTQPMTVDSSKFITATAGTKGEIFVGPATILTVHCRAVGITYIAAASTPLLTVIAVGNLNFPS